MFAIYTKHINEYTAAGTVLGKKYLGAWPLIFWEATSGGDLVQVFVLGGRGWRVSTKIFLPPPSNSEIWGTAGTTV